MIAAVAAVVVTAAVATPFAIALALRHAGPGQSTPPSGATSPSATSSPRASIVPWVDDPAPAGSFLTGPTASPSPAVTPAASVCSASSVSATTQPSSAGGELIFTISVTNTSSHACTLDGIPQVSVFDETGALVDAPQLSPPTFPWIGAEQVVDLAPGGEADVYLAWGDGYCRTSPPAAYAILGLPGAEGSIRTSISGPPSCPTTPTTSGSVTGIQVGYFVPATTASPAPTAAAAQGWAALTATMALPSSTGPGNRLLYTVTLTNPTGLAVQLSSCPAYVETLEGASTQIAPPSNSTKISPSASASGVKESYFLNCADAHTIPAFGAVTFAMELVVPGDTAPGNDVVTWQLLVTGGPTVQMAIRVT
jgi:hypothetical protein